jgi:cell division protein FtsL
MDKKAPQIDELVRRAQAEVPSQEQRYLYTEHTPSTAPQFAVRRNKKAVGRKVSTFYLIVGLFVVGISIVAYVNNIIVINRLSAEINQMQARYDKIGNTNAVLRSEINRKSGWERIGKIAGDEVGLRYPEEQPELFDVDETLMEKARENSTAK